MIYCFLWKGLSTGFKCENTEKEKKSLKKGQNELSKGPTLQTLVNLTLEANEKSVIHRSISFLRYLLFLLCSIIAQLPLSFFVIFFVHGDPAILTLLPRYLFNVTKQNCTCKTWTMSCS